MSAIATLGILASYFALAVLFVAVLIAAAGILVGVIKVEFEITRNDRRAS